MPDLTSTDATADLGEQYRPLLRGELLEIAKKAAPGSDLAISQPVSKALTLEGDVEIKNSSVTFVSTNSKIDRENDTIKASGVNIESWSRSPIILFEHDPRVRIGVGESKLVGANWLTTATYFPRNVSPIAADLFGMIQWRKNHAKTMKTNDAGASFSIGFIATKLRFNEERGGFDFLEIDKLEDSEVSLAANPSALARAAFADGVPMDSLLDWAEKCRRDAGVVGVRADMAEELTRLIDPPKGFKLIELRPADLQALVDRKEEAEPVETPSRAKAVLSTLMRVSADLAPDLSFLEPYPESWARVERAFDRREKQLLSEGKTVVTADEFSALFEAAGFNVALKGEAALEEPKAAEEPTVEPEKKAVEPQIMTVEDELFEPVSLQEASATEAVNRFLASPEAQELITERVAAITGHIPDLQE